jgi:hypothetical protein
LLAEKANTRDPSAARQPRRSLNAGKPNHRDELKAKRTSKILESAPRLHKVGSSGHLVEKDKCLSSPPLPHPGGNKVAPESATGDKKNAMGPELKNSMVQKVSNTPNVKVKSILVVREGEGACMPNLIVLNPARASS